MQDADGLYHCMKQYYDNPELIKLHGKQGRARVIKDFNNNVVSAAWVEYYHNIVG